MKNLEAEQLVIAALLTGRLQAISNLTPADFYRQLHQRIFAAIAHQHVQGFKTDCVAVADELKRRGELELCGGDDYLQSLVEGSMDGFFTLDDALQNVHECARLRRLLDS